jgi:hypothetical protein
VDPALAIAGSGGVSGGLPPSKVEDGEFCHHRYISSSGCWSNQW